jgi:hypothetical protein
MMLTADIGEPCAYGIKQGPVAELSAYNSPGPLRGLVLGRPDFPVDIHYPEERRRPLSCQRTTSCFSGRFVRSAVGIPLHEKPPLTSR